MLKRICTFGYLLSSRTSIVSINVVIVLQNDTSEFNMRLKLIYINVILFANFCLIQLAEWLAVFLCKKTEWSVLLIRYIRF